MPVTSRIEPRAASVLPQKSEIRLTNEHTARSAFSSERLEIFVDQAALLVVEMMQATDVWNLDHRTERGRLDGSADRGIFFCIGSANFNPRSMVDDGELSAFFTGDQVTAFRQRLREHHFRSSGQTPTAATFRMTADQNVSLARRGGMLAGQTYLLPIDAADYPHYWPGPSSGSAANH